MTRPARLVPALVLAALGLLAPAARTADPVVSDIVTTVCGGGALVDITFTLADADGDHCWIFPFGHIPATREHVPMTCFLVENRLACLSDLANKKFSPGVHSIRWIPGGDWGSRSFSNMVIYLRANDSERCAPGRWLVLDLSNGSSASIYPYVLEDFIDARDSKYRTTHFALRELPDGCLTGIYEVTQRQFQLVTGQTPSSFGGNPERPVEMVSWNSVKSSGGFLPLIQSRSGLSMNLHSMSEWTTACRAGTTFNYTDYCSQRGHGTNDSSIALTLGWYSENSGASTHDVGGRQPNAWGLYDMHGNVVEWTRDLYEGCRYHTIGGSFGSVASGCYAGLEGSAHSPSQLFRSLGFRAYMATPPQARGVQRSPDRFDQEVSAPLSVTGLSELLEDFDGNGTPDAFEDFDGNGTPDAFEDFDGNEIPDAFEDFDGNGTPDAFEDFDGNEIPDAFEDFDGNGTPDAFEDFDGNEIPDAFEDFDGNGTPDAFEDFDGNGTPDAFEDFNGNGTPDAFEAKGPDVPFDAGTDAFGAMRVAVSDTSNPAHAVSAHRTYSGSSFRLDWSAFLTDSPGSAGAIYRMDHDRNAPLELHDFDAYVDRGVAQGVYVTLTENACYYVHVAPIRAADASIDRANETVVRIMRESRAPFVRSPTHPDQTTWHAAPNVNIEFAPFHLDGESVARFYFVWDNQPNTAPTKASTSLTAYNRAFIFQPEGTHYFHVRAEDQAGVLSDTAHFQVNIGTPPPPVATFGATPTAGVAPLGVTLTDTSTGSITTRTWNFGDGSAPVVNPTAPVTHTYATPGTYTVSLTVEGSGGTDTQIRASYITVTRPPNNAPVAAVAQAQIFLNSLGDAAVLDASPSSDPDGDPLWFSWREDPRNPVLGLVPLRSEGLERLRLHFPKPGVYVFELVVSDGVLVGDSNPDAPGAQGAYITVYVPGVTGSTYAWPSDDLVRLAGARVGVFANTADAENWRNFLDLTTADSYGQFVLDSFGVNARAADVVIRRQHTGYLSAQDSRTVDSQGLVESYGLRRGQIPEFRGTVLRPDGSPASGVQVAVIAGFNVLGSPTTTGPDGGFALADVWKGSWIMQVMHAQGADVRDILVTEGVSPSVVLNPGTGMGTVSGTVTLLGTGRPVQGATVELGFGGSFAATTNAAGRYEIQNVPVGTYICWVRKDGYEPERRLNVPVADGGNDEDFEITFVGAGPVFYGQVRDALDGNLYLPSATVEVLDGSGRAARSGATDRTGYFQIEDIPQGTQSVRVSAPGYLPRQFDLAVTSSYVGRLVDMQRASGWSAPEPTPWGTPRVGLTASKPLLDYVGDSTQLAATVPGAAGLITYVWRESPDNPNAGGNIPAGAWNLSQWTFNPTQPGIYVFEVQAKVGGARSFRIRRRCRSPRRAWRAMSACRRRPASTPESASRCAPMAPTPTRRTGTGTRCGP